MPAAEFDVTTDLVRRLLADQHPDLATLPVEPLSQGWDNASFRVGKEMIARLPRRAVAAALTEHEQRWLPGLAPRLPLPIPAPARTGRPGHGYPWGWSVVPYWPGRPAAVAYPDPDDAAGSLGSFLAALHLPAPPDAPPSRFRGIPLAGRRELDRRNLDAAGDAVDRAAVLAVQADALAARPWDGPPVWLHGDLHPANILVADGKVSAVIDFGDLTAGDPATDLSVGWMLGIDLRPAYGHAGDEDLWRRARGWALAFGLVFAAHSADNPLMAAIGRRTLESVLGSLPERPPADGEFAPRNGSIPAASKILTRDRRPPNNVPGTEME
jgi:aminoglycoside phosphotransferase (APT) family kinase protein